MGAWPGRTVYPRAVSPGDNNRFVGDATVGGILWVIKVTETKAPSLLWLLCTEENRT